MANLWLGLFEEISSQIHSWNIWILRYGLCTLLLHVCFCGMLQLAKTTSHLPRQLTYCRQRIYPSQWETYALKAEWYTSRSCHVYEVKAALALCGQTQPKVCPHDTKAVLLNGDSLMKVHLLTPRSSSICQTTHSSHCYLQTTDEAVCLSAWGTVHLHIPSSNILHALHQHCRQGLICSNIQSMLSCGQYAS